MTRREMDGRKKPDANGREQKVRPIAEGAGCPLACPNPQGRNEQLGRQPKRQKMSMVASSRKTRLPKHIPLWFAIGGLHLNIRASPASCLRSPWTQHSGLRVLRFGRKGPKAKATSVEAHEDDCHCRGLVAGSGKAKEMPPQRALQQLRKGTTSTSLSL